MSGERRFQPVSTEMPDADAETLSRRDPNIVRSVSQHTRRTIGEEAGSRNHPTNLLKEISMKALLFVSLLVSSQAFATGFNAQNDIDPYGFDQEAIVSVKSRAEVNADAIAAMNNGEVPSGELSAPMTEQLSSKSRAQVVADTIEASRQGLISHGEV
jgi:hypothetical protein